MFAFFVAGSLLKLILIKLRDHEVCTFLAFDYTVRGGNGRLRHKPVAAWRVNVLKFFYHYFIIVNKSNDRLNLNRKISPNQRTEM